METTAPQTPLDVAGRVKEIFEAFVAHGAPGAEQTTRFGFELTGEGGGRFLLQLDPGGVSWQSGYADGETDVSVRLTAEDFVAVADGAFDGRLAVDSERLEISGDRGLAERMLALVAPDAK